MGGLLQFLLGAASTVFGRIIAAFGVSIVTMVGLDALRQQVETAVLGSLGNIASSAYQIISLAGFVTAIGIALSALASAVAVKTLSSIKISK